MNSNVNFFRKYRAVISGIFGIFVSCIYFFLLNIWASSFNSGFGLGFGLIILVSFPCVIIFPAAFLYKILKPTNSEETTTSNLQTSRASSVLKWFLITTLIILLIVVVALIAYPQFFTKL